MLRTWVYRRCGRLQGPITLEDLRAAAYLGFLRPGDLVRDPTTTTWVEACDLAALREVFPGGHSNKAPQASLGERDLGLS